MAQADSFTAALAGLRAGDAEAARQVWDRSVGLPRARLRARLLGRVEKGS